MPPTARAAARPRTPGPAATGAKPCASSAWPAWLGGNASQRKGLHRAQGSGRRSRPARPVGCTSPAQALRELRLRPAALRYVSCARLFVGLGPRRRTPFRLGPVTMRFIGKRRALAERCRRRGFELITAGLWYDRAANVVYYQSAGGLGRCEHIQLGAA